MTGIRSADPTGLPPAVQGCLEACRRCETFVDLVTRDESTADRNYRIIGRHLRHCVDHFICLLQGLDSGTVDYDAREREEAMERDPQRIREVLGAIAEGLQAIDPAGIRRGLTLLQEAAPGGRRETAESTLERELIFLSGHTIHHLAIMALLAQAEGIRVPQDLCMAFSTATHLERTAGTSAGVNETG